MQILEKWAIILLRRLAETIFSDDKLQNENSSYNEAYRK
jgi:hypothetical protein